MDVHESGARLNSYGLLIVRDVNGLDLDWNYGGPGLRSIFIDPDLDPNPYLAWNLCVGFRFNISPKNSFKFEITCGLWNALIQSDKR